MKNVCGLDVHKDSIFMCIIKKNGDKVEEKFGVEIYHHLKKGMKVNEYHTNLDGCGYIVARANTQKEAVEKAEKVLDYFKEVLFED